MTDVSPEDRRRLREIARGDSDQAVLARALLVLLADRDQQTAALHQLADAG